jgi:OmpA-OmpF porin, OOP family
MKLHRTSGLLGLVTLAALSGSALAQDSDWYVGGSIGRSAATIDDARIRSGLLGQGLSTTSISENEHDRGYKLFGGYQLNRYFGIEGGYFDLGRFGYTATTVPAGTLNGNIRSRGLNLDLVGTLPIVDRLSVLGRIGVTSIQSRDAFGASGAARVPYANANPSERSANVKVGIGLAYDITDALSIRGEAERYRLRDAVGNRGNVDLFSVGLVYRFGTKSQPIRVAAPEPIFVAAAPPPAVVPPPPPPPSPPPVVQRAAPLRFSLAADSLFDFDKSTLKPAGIDALNKLLADLKGLNVDAMQVTGHTDRIGSHNYNLKLSIRRAESVSAYLSQNSSNLVGKITARGVDGADPVTKPSDCKGSKATPALIACLQPDRRVNIEVTGTR